MLFRSITYLVTPFVNGCPGDAQNVSVTVNPYPVINPLSPVTICSGLPLQISLTANIQSQFNWQADSNPNITGESVTANNTAVISDTLINNTGILQVINYHITPVSVSGACPGNEVQLAVSVEPAPSLNIPAPTVICGGDTLGIPLTSNIPATFSWNAIDNQIGRAHV